MFEAIKNLILIIGAFLGIYSAPMGDSLISISPQVILEEYNKAPKSIKDKYVLEGSSFNMMAKNEWKDRIVTKVGNENGDFTPTLKVERWDNEVNMEITLKDNEIGTPAVSFNNDKIVWQKGNKEVNFYDLPVSAENPEGAFEFEVILKEKPTTNKIEFTLQDKDVEYFYQPELTQEEIDQGSKRPENVVGSYAVYASEQKTNWTGGKEYKCGKIGHIYRPKIIDSVGTEVWGDLHIENGILSVTIPQDFLDRAIYPVRHAAGLTFGFEGIGETGVETGSGEFRGSVFTAGSAGTVTKLTWYDNVGGEGRGIITDSSGNILTNGVGGTGTPNWDFVAGWRESLISNASITATDYWLGVIGLSFCQAKYDSVTDIGRHDSSNDYLTPTNPTDAVTNNEKISIYATYTASGGGAAPTFNQKRKVIISE